MFLPARQVKEIVRAAMREKAPMMYRELAQAGELERAIDDRAAQYREMTAEAMGRSTTLQLSGDRSKRPHKDVAASLAQDRRRAHDSVLAVVLEFPS